jgi:AsmA protein
MRKVGIAILIIILVIIVAAVVFAATFDVNRYKGTIQSELEKRLGRNVTLGDMHLGVFPPRFRLQNLSIADDPKFGTQKPFVQAQELAVSVKLLPLLHKSVEVDSLNLQRPSVELIKNQQGVWNFSSIGQTAGQPAPEQGKQPAPTQPKQPAPATPQTGTSQGGANQKAEQQQFSLGKLVVQDGQVAITDMQAKAPRAVYDHIDVTLKNFAPDQPFTLDAAAHLPGAGTQEVRLQGDGGPIVQANPATTPFHGTLNLKQVGIAGLAKFLNSPALVNTDGILSGQTKIDSKSGNLAAQGQMEVANAKVHGVDLGYPIRADYDVTDDLPADMITVRNTTLKLGQTPLNINGTVNSKPTPAVLDLNLKANNVSIAEMAKMAAAFGTALPPGTNVTGNVNANIHAQGAADKPALNGTVNGRNIQMSGKDAPQPVQIQAVNLTLTPTEIHSDNFNITSGGTNVAAQFGLKQYLSKNPMIDATLKAPNAALPGLLSIAKAYGVTALDKVSGAGNLNLDMHAAGPLSSLNSNSVMRALNGNLNLNFNDVKYTGADITQQLGAIAGFANKLGQKSQGITNILRMTGNVIVKNGIAQTNNLQALLDIGNLGVTGTANLVDEALNLRATAVLSKEFSQKLGGTAGIGGYMQTALANNNAEIVIPVLVTGTLQNPKFQPDLQQMAQMKLKGLVPNFNDPGAAVSGVLGNLLGQKGKNPGQSPQQQTTQQQPQQQNPVQQLMGIFGKKKQQQQQPPPK